MFEADVNRPGVKTARGYLPRIQELYAFLYVDEEGDGEGLCGYYDPITSTWIAMIAADKAKLSVLRPEAEIIAKKIKGKIRLAKFTHREDLEIIDGNK